MGFLHKTESIYLAKVLLLAFCFFHARFASRHAAGYASPTLTVISPESGKRLLSDQIVVIILVENAKISDTLNLCIEQVDAGGKTECWEDYGFGKKGYFTTSLQPEGSTFFNYFRVSLSAPGSGGGGAAGASRAPPAAAPAPALATAAFSVTLERFAACAPRAAPRPVHLALAFHLGLDLLEMVFEEVGSKVESIALMETSQSIVGERKPLQFSENRQRFERFQVDVVAGMDTKNHTTVDQVAAAWWGGLAPLLARAGPADAVLLLATGEVPSSELILRLQSCADLTFPIVPLMDWYMYNLNWHGPEPWGLKLLQGPVVVTVAQLRAAAAAAGAEGGVAALRRPADPGGYAGRNGWGGAAAAAATVSVFEGGGWHFQGFKDEDALSEQDAMFQATGLAQWELRTLAAPEDKFFSYAELRSPVGLPLAVSKDVERFGYLLPNVNGFESDHREALEFWVMQAATHEQRRGGGGGGGGEGGAPAAAAAGPEDEVLALSLDCALGEEGRRAERAHLEKKYGPLLGVKFHDELVNECSKKTALQMSGSAEGLNKVDSFTRLFFGSDGSSSKETRKSQTAELEFVLPVVWTLEVNIGETVLYHKMDLRKPFDILAVQRFCRSVMLSDEGCREFEKHAYQTYQQRSYHQNWAKLSNSKTGREEAWDSIHAGVTKEQSESQSHVGDEPPRVPVGQRMAETNTEKYDHAVAQNIEQVPTSSALTTSSPYSGISKENPPHETSFYMVHRSRKHAHHPDEQQHGGMGTNDKNAMYNDLFGTFYHHKNEDANEPDTEVAAEEKAQTFKETSGMPAKTETTKAREGMIAESVEVRLSEILGTHEKPTNHFLRMINQLAKETEGRGAWCHVGGLGPVKGAAEGGPIPAHAWWTLAAALSPGPRSFGMGATEARLPVIAVSAVFQHPAPEPPAALASLQTEYPGRLLPVAGEVAPAAAAYAALGGGGGGADSKRSPPCAVVVVGGGAPALEDHWKSIVALSGATSEQFTSAAMIIILDPAENVLPSSTLEKGLNEIKRIEGAFFDDEVDNINTNNGTQHSFNLQDDILSSTNISGGQEIDKPSGGAQQRKKKKMTILNKRKGLEYRAQQDSKAKKGDGTVTTKRANYADGIHKYCTSGDFDASCDVTDHPATSSENRASLTHYGNAILASFPFNFGNNKKRE